MSVDERSRLGLLQSFQYPTEVPGVRLEGVPHSRPPTSGGCEPEEAADRIEDEAVRFDTTRFLDRSVNNDLSGGEKKRSEIFQMAVLRPKVAMLDEIDSGLDIDAVRQVSDAVEEMRSPDLGVVMITHYSRILRYLMPDRIHVMIDGRIVASGWSRAGRGAGQRRLRVGSGPSRDPEGGGRAGAQGVRLLHRHPVRRLIAWPSRSTIERWLGRIDQSAHCVRTGRRRDRLGQGLGPTSS